MDPKDSAKALHMLTGQVQDPEPAAEREGVPYPLSPSANWAVLAGMPVRLLAIRRAVDDLLSGLAIDGDDYEEDAEHLAHARQIMKHVRQLELDVSELGGPGALP
jgi:hypothetical protein